MLPLCSIRALAINKTQPGVQKVHISPSWLPRACFLGSHCVCHHRQCSFRLGFVCAALRSSADAAAEISGLSCNCHKHVLLDLARLCTCAVRVVRQTWVSLVTLSAILPDYSASFQPYHRVACHATHYSIPSYSSKSHGSGICVNGRHLTGLFWTFVEQHLIHLRTCKSLVWISAFSQALRSPPITYLFFARQCSLRGIVPDVQAPSRKMQHEVHSPEDRIASSSHHSALRSSRGRIKNTAGQR